MNYFFDNRGSKILGSIIRRLKPGNNRSRMACAHTRSEHSKEDEDLQLLISPFITARKIADIYWVIFSCFNSVYSPILFSCWLFNWDYESVSPKTELNLITWLICFLLKKKIDEAQYYMFYQDLAHSKVTKGRTVNAKWTAFMFVQSSTDKGKYICMLKKLAHIWMKRQKNQE